MNSPVKSKPRLVILYLLLLTAGAAWTVWFATHQNTSPQEVAWTFWAASFLTGPFFLLAGQAERIWRPDTKIKTSVRIFFAVVAVLFGLLSIYVVHGITGAFLSIINEIEPLYYFGRNGYINHFSFEACWVLLERFSILLPGYLMVKASYLLASKNARLTGHATVRDPLFVLLGVVAALFFHARPQTALLAFAAVFFFPWSVAVSKDITSKRRDQEPDLAPEVQLPVIFIDRGSRFWGVFISAFGLMFLIIGLFFPYYMIAKDGFTVGAGLASLLFLFAFVGFASMAILFGTNMIFNYRRIQMDRMRVTCEQFRVFPKFKKSNWQEPLAHYTVGKDLIHHRDSDGASYDEYLVVLNHKDNKEKNVTLYRAYHEEGWLMRLEEWQKLLHI